MTLFRIQPLGQKTAVFVEDLQQFAESLRREENSAAKHSHRLHFFAAAIIVPRISINSLYFLCICDTMRIRGAARDLVVQTVDKAIILSMTAVRASTGRNGRLTRRSDRGVPRTPFRLEVGGSRLVEAGASAAQAGERESTALPFGSRRSYCRRFGVCCGKVEDAKHKQGYTEISGPQVSRDSYLQVRKMNSNKR